MCYVVRYMAILKEWLHNLDTVIDFYYYMKIDKIREPVYISEIGNL
jgi:hypothetical protein